MEQCDGVEQQRVWLISTSEKKDRGLSQRACGCACVRVCALQSASPPLNYMDISGLRGGSSSTRSHSGSGPQTTRASSSPNRSSPRRRRHFCETSRGGALGGPRDAFVCRARLNSARREWLHLRAATATWTPGWKSKLARWSRRWSPWWRRWAENKLLGDIWYFFLEPQKAALAPEHQPC